MKRDKRQAVYSRVTRGLRENGQEYFAAPGRRELMVPLRGKRVRTIHAVMRVSDDASTLEVRCRLHADGGPRMRGVMRVAAAMANYLLPEDLGTLSAIFSYSHVDREVTLEAQWPATRRDLGAAGIALLLRHLRALADAFFPGFLTVAYDDKFPEEAMLRSRSGKPTPTRPNDPRIDEFAPMFIDTEEDEEDEPGDEAARPPEDVRHDDKPDEAPAAFPDPSDIASDEAPDDDEEEPAGRRPVATPQWIRNFRGEMTDHTEGAGENSEC